MKNTISILISIIVLVLILIVGFWLSVQRRLNPTGPLSVFYTPDVQHRTITKTNSWFSSAYSFPSESLFTFPGAFKITAKGLEVSYPNVSASEKLLTAGFDPYCSLSRGVPVMDATVRGYGDFTVHVQLTDIKGNWDVYLSQGSLFTSIENAGDTLHVDCTAVVVSENAQTLTVDRNGKQLFIQANDPNAIETISPTQKRVHSKTGQYRIGFWGDTITAQQKKSIAESSWNPVLDTHISYTQKSDEFKTTYDFIGQTQDDIFIVLWPHQKDIVVDKGEVIDTYQTLYGTMELVSGRSFTTRVPASTLPFSFIKETNLQQTQEILQALRADTQSYPQTTIPEGVYFKGTWLGGLATLIQLTDTYGLTQERDALLLILENELKKSLKEFTYNSDKKMFVALKPEFGNENGNDHHFHYGYYIRAAAILAKYKPESLSDIKPVISEMVADISNTEKNSTRYPFLRSYSPYEGHSWADGVGKFADGNNQESTSESLHAWYALTLWADVTGDIQLRERGSWLFAQELTGTKSYWFGQDNPFPAEYKRTLASLVWGGKREYTTWFSPQPLHIVGIQLLPLTPASVYLSEVTTLPTILAEAKTLTGNPYTHEWGDLYAAVEALSETKISPSTVSTTAGTKLRSLFLHTIYSVQ